MFVIRGRFLIKITLKNDSIVIFNLACQGEKDTHRKTYEVIQINVFIKVNVNSIFSVTRKNKAKYFSRY